MIADQVPGGPRTSTTGRQSGAGLAVFLSHPIQHFVPWLRQLNQQLPGGVVVHYASRQGVEARLDPEFGATFAWDMDLLSGYVHRFWEDGGRRGPNDGFWGVRYPGIGTELRRNPPRAVLIWGWLFAGYWEAAGWARRAGVPYLLRGESNLLAGDSAARWWVKRHTIGRLCRAAAGCLSIGSRNTGLYEAYGVPDERIWTAPYFVDNDWFLAESARLREMRPWLRSKLGIAHDAIVFLFMGKFVHKKHPDLLLRAWKRLPPDARAKSAVVMAGSGTMESELRHIAAADPRIVFAGLLNRRELPEAYATSDVLVLPSDAGETWGLVVNEAMVSGLPAVVSDQVGCAPDLIRQGATGFTFPCGDERALSDLLQSMIDRPTLVSTLGAAARSHVSAVASVERAVSATVDAIEAVSPAPAGAVTS